MVLVPPAMYDHQPTIPVIEQVIQDLDVVNQKCMSIGLPMPPYGKWWYGCNFTKNGVCYVYRVDDDLVRRHELAHCNGWRHEDEIKAYYEGFKRK